MSLATWNFFSKMQIEGMTKRKRRKQTHTQNLNSIHVIVFTKLNLEIQKWQGLTSMGYKILYERMCVCVCVCVRTLSIQGEKGLIERTARQSRVHPGSATYCVTLSNLPNIPKSQFPHL